MKRKIMKRNKYILLGAVALGLGLTSCSDYLNVDRYFRDQQSTERIFSDKDYTLQWLSFCYSRLQGDNLEVGHSDVCPFNFSDDQVFNERGDRFAKFKRGEYLNSTGGQNAWKWSYDGIYQASILLNELHENQDLTPEEVTDVRGQARFLRAYFYWMLLRKFGPIPILPPEGADYTKSYDELAYPRNTYDECVQFITSELEIAATELFEKRDNLNIARPTKGAALAVRAKVFLYAASPLVNGNTEMADFTNKDGKQLIPQEYNEEKWAKAAAAARDMIDYSEASGLYKLYTFERRPVSTDEAYPTTIEPPYHEEYSNKPFPEGWANIDPFESYRSIFNGDIYAAENQELIFTRGTNGDSNDLKTDNTMVDFVKHQLPGTFGGYNVHGITLKQSEAYDMADGKPFSKEYYTLWKGKFTNDENKDEHKYDHVKNNVWWGYTNREPRFYASVAFNGAIWNALSIKEEEGKDSRNKQIWYYRGATDGRINGSDNWCITGIGIMKYVNPNDCAKWGGSIYQKVEPTLRYADILLMYAEALNNISEGAHYQIASWDGNQTYDISRDKEQMRRGVKPVRMRAGVPDYSDEIYENPEKFFEKIVHERQIEFFAETQRFYDLRRWKIVEEHESEQIYGCNTLMNEEYKDMYYLPVRVAELQTSFSRKQYFWPISFDELKRNKNLSQAPGWQYYD